MTEKEKGLHFANQNIWNLALLHLNHAARQKKIAPQGQLHLDIELLDALGEAVYRNNTPEILSPYQNYYKYPSIAVHAARAFLMLGDIKSCHEFLSYAKDSALKAAVYALSEMDGDIEKTIRLVLPVAEKYPDLYYPEYWRALAAVADSVDNEELTQLAERKSKKWAYKDPNIHFNQALRMLGKKEFHAGWRLYEWRLVPGGAQSNRTELGSIPMWEGESLQNKKLLIFLEQGLGDCLFSLRYVQYFLQNDISVQIVARPGLIPVIQSTFPKCLVRNEDDVADVNYWSQTTDHPDCWVYALSIPYRANLVDPIFCGPYLKINSESVLQKKSWIEKYNPENLEIYTINWHGRIDTDSDRTRAFNVKEFYSASGLKNKKCLLLSIQKDITDAEENEWQELAQTNHFVFVNAAAQIQNFEDTAALILNSKKLITNDTSVSHLSGALGHDTLVLARNKTIWQWTTVHDQPDYFSKTIYQSIWYHSVKIQYHLKEKNSWLFTTLKKKDVYGVNESNAEFTIEKKQDDLQSKAVLPANRRTTKIRFAGRSV